MVPKMAKTTKDDFESQLTKLEAIVQELESGELGLEKSLESFEEGVKLYKSCKSTLSRVEKKVAKLSDGLREEEFDSQE